MEGITNDKKSLKIAMLGHKYVPSREGGVEIVVENLASEMVKAGNAVTLFNRKRKEYKNISEYNGCKLESVFTVNKKSLDAVIYAYYATRKVKKEAKKGNFDVLHFHAEGACLFLKKFRSKKRNYKVIVTIHGLDWQRAKWGGLAARIIRKSERNAVKYADEIIVLSEHLRDYFKQEYGRDTVFIPNGVSSVSLRTADLITSKWGLKENSYVLFLARIVPEKGVHYLLEAWQNLTKEIDADVKLVIAGGSSHSDEYYQKIVSAAQDQKSVICTGFVEGQALEELYSNALLYVLPSDIEGMPMSLLEAVSYGNKCLVSDIPENVAVIGENGLTFKKGDVADLTQKLKDALQSGGVDRKQNVSLPTWEEVAEKTLNLYRGKK